MNLLNLVQSLNSTGAVTLLLLAFQVIMGILTSVMLLTILLKFSKLERSLGISSSDSLTQFVNSLEITSAHLAPLFKTALTTLSSMNLQNQNLPKSMALAPENLTAQAPENHKNNLEELKLLKEIIKEIDNEQKR